MIKEIFTLIKIIKIQEIANMWQINKVLIMMAQHFSKLKEDPNTIKWEKIQSDSMK